MLNARKIEAALVDIEKARREERYADMNNDSHAVLAKLHGDQSARAWRWRSRVSYERHMAKWQKKEIHESYLLAMQSAREARLGGDSIGILFAEVNLGGHILPAQGKWEEGYRLLARAYMTAVNIRSQTRDSAEMPRSERVSMNALTLRIALAIKYTHDWLYVEEWLEALRANSIFALYKEEGWARELVRDAEGFVTKHMTS